MVSPSTVDDPLAAWMDCYCMKPKKRIKKRDAKDEIQRAWAKWDGDKTGPQLLFYTWLQRQRPYFLTFTERGNGDQWQTVKSWIDQYEQQARCAK
ncbi:hypothetical protein AWB67_06821 [Caballeronia terrestris]|uniref:Uncharacterized protein n=2 Tax=Burkholderiaceae TaxID=119060 RepID=A0A158KV09_9BURK|nr:hypothetical protein AWB81_07439 [Caballeronia arationis]SAL84992.1 hypothetical protein AWB67_06821 [Caballeronia terrestris]